MEKLFIRRELWRELHEMAVSWLFGKTQERFQDQLYCLLLLAIFKRVAETVAEVLALSV